MDSRANEVGLATYVLHPKRLRGPAESSATTEIDGALTDLVLLHLGGAPLLLLLLRWHGGSR
jgi:hypothetical protein